MRPFQVFIGYDPNEAVAYHVLEHSLRKHSSIPLAITPLDRKQLLPVFTRERLPNESSEFSFSRFMPPYLCAYKGWALYMDCDMLVRADIAELAAMCNDVNAWYKSVFVVKHDYESVVTTKFLGATNEQYPCKNWSSLMLFNNFRCRALTPQVVNEGTGPYLHRFQWLAEDQVGELPKQWNHLVDEYAIDPQAKCYHYTLGGPYFPEYDGCEGSDEWWDNFGETIYAKTSGLCGKASDLRRLAADATYTPVRRYSGFAAAAD